MKPYFNYLDACKNQFYCDHHDACHSIGISDVRWRCHSCDYDICFACAKGTSNTSAPGHYLSSATSTSRRIYEKLLAFKHTNRTEFSKESAVEMVSEQALQLLSYFDSEYGIEAHRADILIYLNPNGEEKILYDTVFELMFGGGSSVGGGGNGGIGGGVGGGNITLSESFFKPFHHAIQQYHSFALTGKEQALSLSHAHAWAKNPTLVEKYFGKHNSIGIVQFIPLYLERLRLQAAAAAESKQQHQPVKSCWFVPQPQPFQPFPTQQPTVQPTVQPLPLFQQPPKPVVGVLWNALNTPTVAPFGAASVSVPNGPNMAWQQPRQPKVPMQPATVDFSIFLQPSTPFAATATPSTQWPLMQPMIKVPTKVDFSTTFQPCQQQQPPPPPQQQQQQAWGQPQNALWATGWNQEQKNSRPTQHVSKKTRIQCAACHNVAEGNKDVTKWFSKTQRTKAKHGQKANCINCTGSSQTMKKTTVRPQQQQQPTIKCSRCNQVAFGKEIDRWFSKKQKSKARQKKPALCVSCTGTGTSGNKGKRHPGKRNQPGARVQFPSSSSIESVHEFDQRLPANTHLSGQRGRVGNGRASNNQNHNGFQKWF